MSVFPYKNKFLLSVCVFSLLSLNGCAFFVVGAAGTAAGVAASQEGGISRAADDARIQTQINDLWFRHNIEMFRKLDLTVNEGRVLITGVVQDPQHRVEAVRLAWQPKGIVQVINEIKVADSDGVVGFAKDSWITTRLRAIILVDSNIESMNYSIDTVQGTVYLMGFANNQEELDRVIAKARTIENVRQVVSYVRLVGSAEPKASSNNTDAGYSGYDSAPPPSDENLQGGSPIPDVGAAEPLQ